MRFATKIVVEVSRRIALVGHPHDDQPRDRGRVPAHTYAEARVRSSALCTIGMLRSRRSRSSSECALARFTPRSANLTLLRRHTDHSRSRADPSNEVLMSLIGAPSERFDGVQDCGFRYPLLRAHLLSSQCLRGRRATLRCSSLRAQSHAGRVLGQHRARESGKARSDRLDDGPSNARAAT